MKLQNAVGKKAITLAEIKGKWLKGKVGQLLERLKKGYILSRILITLNT